MVRFSRMNIHSLPGSSFSGRLVRSFGVVALITLFLAGMASAQSQAINGTIRGRTTDKSGAPVVAATVTVQNSATGFARSAQTNDDGYYIIPNLPLGSYEVKISKEGFADVKATNVILDAGREAVIDGAMPLAGVSTTIEVIEGAPLIQTGSADVGRTIETREIENLPLTSRNPYNFILFQPGVSGHPNPELGIPRTLNTNGLLDRINYQMDGMVDTETDRHGLRLFPISDAYVREVQTVSNSFAPEFGQTSGDIFNVVTSSGTNSVHGVAQYIRRPEAASAGTLLFKPTAAIPKPLPSRLEDYIGNIGGPAIKDKLFWFAGYEHLVRGVPAPVTISSANAALIGLSPAVLAPGPGLLHGQFFDVRSDYSISAKHTAFLRYNYFSNNFPFNTNVGGLNALDASSDFLDRAHVIGFQLVSTFTPNLLNEFRFSWPYRQNRHFGGALTGPGPNISISGAGNFNGTTAAGDRFVEKIPNLNENVTVIHGRHSFKFGGAWQENIDTQQIDSFTQYNFSSVANYLLAKSGANPRSYSTAVVQNGGTGVHYRSVFFSFYGQDSWQFTPKLMLVYGLRYDKFVPPDADPNAPFILSRNFVSPSANFAPRLGVAYKVTDKTVVRASGGIFYDAPATNTWFNPLAQNGNLTSFSFAPATPGSPAFPTVLTTVTPAPGTFPNVIATSQSFRNAYTINTSLQVQQQISRNDAVTLGYIHTGGRNLEFLRNMNLINPTGFLADGRPKFAAAVNAGTRLFPQFNNITLQDSGANSDYEALVLNYTRRFSHGVQMAAAYTWSHTISNAPDANSFEQNLVVEDLTNPLRDRGNSSVNRPHSLTFSSLLEPKMNGGNRIARAIVNDNLFAILGNVASGDQQNITAAGNLNGDTLATSVNRPAFIGRNTLRGPNIYQFDLRYTRTIITLFDRIKPQFFVEANNLFNHPNITSLNTAGVPVNADGTINQAAFANLTTFKTPSSTVLEGRLVQFGATIRF